MFVKETNDKQTKNEDMKYKVEVPNCVFVREFKTFKSALGEMSDLRKMGHKAIILTRTADGWVKGY